MKTYAVIFKTLRELPMPKEYQDMNAQMFKLAQQQEGFLGIDSVANDDGQGVSISYWSSLESIQTWQKNSEHLKAQALGKSTWYKYYKVEVCEILRSYEGSHQSPNSKTSR